jgi:hypothetical protein
MSSILINLNELYQRTFGSTPYVIPGQSPGDVAGDSSAQVGKAFTINGTKPDLSGTLNSQLRTMVAGVEIWLPTTIVATIDGVVTRVELPYSVIRVTAKKTIIKTPLMDRRGSVKEIYNIDDYQFSIKGFLIDQARIFPEKEMLLMKRLFETNESVELINPIANIFLSNAEQNGVAEEMDKVVIEDLDFPEVEGGRTHVRPFSMKLESDTIFTLEVVE